MKSSLSFLRPLLAASAICLLGTGCFTYRVATHAQGATDRNSINHTKAYSLFWGLINKPQVITTPMCDSLGSYGVSEVVMKTNLGNTLITIVTLGIYAPIRVEWRCAKPCPQEGSL